MSARAEAGITMLEVLVVMGIFVLGSGFALLFSLETLRGTTFRGDRDLFVSLLQRARAQAINNVCISTCTEGKPHGVAVVGNTYVLFEGNSYASRTTASDSVFESSRAVARAGDTEVLFGQLTGTTSVQKLFTLSDAERTSVVTVEINGRIHWTY